MFHPSREKHTRFNFIIYLMFAEWNNASLWKALSAFWRCSTGERTSVHKRTPSPPKKGLKASLQPQKFGLERVRLISVCWNWSDRKLKSYESLITITITIAIDMAPINWCEPYLSCRSLGRWSWAKKMVSFCKDGENFSISKDRYLRQIDGSSDEVHITFLSPICDVILLFRRFFVAPSG